jgi:membrane-bound lytic murein transglycosylase D
MKNLLKYLLPLPIIFSCSSTKNLPLTKTEIIRDTIYIEKIIKQTNPWDTTNKRTAYVKSKELNELATEEFYKGNEKKADSLYKTSLKYLSQSNLQPEDYDFLDFNSQLKRLESYKEVKEREKNGIDVTEKEINEVLKEEKFPIGKEFATKVAYWEKYYKTKGNKWFKKTLEKFQQYSPYLDSLLEEKELDPFIKYMYPIESGMNSKIKSRAGAAGIAQFMSWTAKQYGLNVYGNWCDERLDPIKSLEASTDYMRYLTDIFNDPAMAIAAYNAGQGRIVKHINRMKLSSYQELLKSGILPKETEEHIPKIYAFMELEKETKITDTKKDLILEKIIKNDFDTIKITQQIDLDVISKILGIDTKTLRKYNPAYSEDKLNQMWSTPPEYMVKGKYEFIFRIPKGTKKDFYEKIAKENPMPKPRNIYYTIKRGDTLSEIGSKFGISYRKIMKANGIINARSLKPGQRIIIPGYR